MSAKTSVDVVSFTEVDAPQIIERENRQRRIAIWATPRGRPLGDVAGEFQPLIAKADLGGASVVYGGQLRLMRETNGNMGLALLLGVLFIYMILAAQFESFTHPLTILVTLPLALVGGLFALFLTDQRIAMGAWIGLVVLLGLITKNAILRVDRAIVRVRDLHESPTSAMLAAGPERLRPIMMTSAAMILGMAPAAVSRAEGSEFRAPMVIAIIGGVLNSTLLSWVVVPVVYLAFEDLKRIVARAIGRARTVSPVARHG